MSQINAQTRLVTLLGYPLGHSLSPLIHNTAFVEQQVNMVYLCFPVAPSDFGTAVAGLTAAQCVGSNVTIPHKQRAMQLADVLSERAEAVGAVNTLVCNYDEEGALDFILGDNTDVQGFVDSLKGFEDRINGEHVVVLGSGGSARAVVYGLVKHFPLASLTIAARSLDKAHRIKENLSGYGTFDRVTAVELSQAGPVIHQSSLVVNTTPVGMYPRVDDSPCPEDVFTDNQIVYDLIYNPLKTLFLRQAEQRGATIISGLDMLIRQAASSYVQWTGLNMPVSIVRGAVEKHLISASH